MSTKYRFSGKIGEEYELFKLACPHFDLLEERIGKEISEYCKKFNIQIIKALEVGCGNGYTTKIILESDNRIRLNAIDNEEVMIKQAKENLDEFVKIKRLELIKEDALIYLKSQPSNSFDIFVSGFTLHNFLVEYRNSVLKEIYRVLKPRGLFVNGDKYVLDNDKEHKKSLLWQINKFKEKYGDLGRQDLANEWINHYLEDNKEDRIMKEKESISIMRTIGFRGFRIAFRQQMEAILIAYK